MEITHCRREMRPLNAYMVLLILCISFCFTLPSSSQGVGFGNGAIDLGGLVICQIKNLTGVWTAHEGGPDNTGATFYEPSSLPDGFFMLGSYSQSKTSSAPGYVLAGKDASNDSSKVILKSPIDYALVMNSTSLAIKQDVVAYIWQPIAPEGYTAVGNVVTGSPEKPPLDKMRCVRSDFVAFQENGNFVWGAGDGNSSYSFNVYSSKGDRGNLVPTGTFVVQGNGSTTSSVVFLKNLNENSTTTMPTIEQIQELIQKYSPVIYFHPDEEFFPSSVSWFFENGALLYKKGQESNPVPVDSTGSNLPQDGSNDQLYWLDLPIDDAARGKVMTGNLQNAGAYMHIKPAVGGTCTDIAIWVFYPFNGPATLKVQLFNIKLGRIGEHVGDWEHVTLRISNLDGELKSVFFSQHSKGVWLDKSEIEYQDSKPVVYSSLHGHAAYPNPGTNLVGNDNIGIPNDAAKGNMFMDTGVRYTIISAEYLQPRIVEPSWLNYAREWGPKVSYDLVDDLSKFIKFLPKPLKEKIKDTLSTLPNEILGEEGPTGPKFKDSWNGDEQI